MSFSQRTCCGTMADDAHEHDCPVFRQQLRQASVPPVETEDQVIIRELMKAAQDENASCEHRESRFDGMTSTGQFDRGAAQGTRWIVKHMKEVLKRHGRG